MIDLRELPIFASFDDDELACFTTPGYEYPIEPGTVICAEGDPPRGLFILLEGELEIVKWIGGEERLLAIMEPGSFVGEISLLTGMPHTATARATVPSRLLRFQPSQFEGVQESPVIALLLRTMAERLKNTEQSIQTHQKLSALGKLAAGLAHEINNPAAASLRAIEQLPALTMRQQGLLLRLSTLGLTPQQFERLHNLERVLIERSMKPLFVTPLERSDREEALIAWMDVRDVANGWEIAPTLVNAGVTEADLAALESLTGGEVLRDALAWLENAITTAELMRTIHTGMYRIVDLVKAVKEYSYMDQGAVQEVDIHEGLDNTLKMLGHKLKSVQVIRSYDPTLPHITAYGSELNQVWTNLIDNAIDAMDGKGVITLRTHQENDRAIVEVCDNGSGIPPEIQQRIFEPFFTTKKVGLGTGIGLDMVWKTIVVKHRGNIRVESEPGDTRFIVSLPLHRSESDEHS